MHSNNLFVISFNLVKHKRFLKFWRQKLYLGKNIKSTYSWQTRFGVVYCLKQAKGGGEGGGQPSESENLWSKISGCYGGFLQFKCSSYRNYKR